MFHRTTPREAGRQCSHEVGTQHTHTRGHLLAWLLHCPPDSCQRFTGKAAGDGSTSCSWVPVAYVRDLDAVPGSHLWPGFPWLLLGIWGIHQWMKKISFHLYLCSFLSAFQIKQNFKFNKIYIRKQKEKPLAHCNHQNLLHMHHVLNNQPKDSQRSRTLWRRHLRCICLTSLAGNRSSPFLLQQDNTSSYAISKVTDKNEGSVAKNVVCVWMHILIRWSEQSNYF